MDDFKEPVLVTLADGVVYQLKYTIGTIRRLISEDNIDVLSAFGSQEAISKLITGTNVDKLLIAGIKRKKRLPDGITEEQIVDGVEELPIHGIIKVIKSLQKAIEQTLLDPDAPPPDPNAQPKPSTGAISTPPAE